MRLLKKFWKSVKRNPIINAALAAIVLQALQSATEDGKFSLGEVGGYLLQFGFAYVAREFTVPLRENRELKDKFSEALLATAENFAGYVPPEDHDRAVLKATKDAERLTRQTIESELMDPHFKKGGYSE